MAGVRLEHIVKRYPDGTEAVKDFHLEIKDKEFIVFVGPSGCGKSTTLRMIAGLEDISDGNLYIGDRRVNDVPPKDRDIAMVFQSYALYPHMSVFQNMAFGLKLRKFKKSDIEKRVKAAAKILDLEELLERRPKALSGGQQQRVALGRAIVREPQVFLMDEPLSNLDAKLRSQMRTEISKLHRRLETTMIYVTHDQIEAMTMGDRIVVMSSGIIQQAASPEDLYRYPNNVFVAGFIGSPAMNFVRGDVTEVDGHIMFTSEGLNVAVPDGRAQILKEKNYIGKEVIFGIRPEDIHDEPVFLEGSQESIFTAHIEVAENLGAEMYIHISGVGRDLITARLDGRTAYKEASEVKLALDMNKIHMFDIETELSIFGRL